MTMTKCLNSLSATAVLLVITWTPVAAQDVLIGSWKLDTGKSTFTPGPSPKTQTLTFSGDKQSVKLQLIEDRKVAASSEFEFNGKTFPVKSSPLFNALSATAKKTPGADFAFEVQWKSAGNVSLNCNAVVAQGSQLLTIVTTGTDANGRTVNNYRVFQKQK